MANFGRVENLTFTLLLDDEPLAPVLAGDVLALEAVVELLDEPQPATSISATQAMSVDMPFFIASLTLA